MHVHRITQIQGEDLFYAQVRIWISKLVPELGFHIWITIVNPWSGKILNKILSSLNWIQEFKIWLAVEQKYVFP